jgi:hypothetical protein
MSENEALRASILQEADTYGSKRRFGLFSSPVSHAVGDDGQYKTKLRKCSSIQTPETNQANLKPSREGSSPTLLEAVSSKSPSLET